MTFSKRTAVFILCAFLLLSNLSGCGSSDPAIVTASVSSKETESLSIPLSPMEIVSETEPTSDNSIPEKPWSVEDWVSIQYQQEFVWTDDPGNQNIVSITLPCIKPVYDFAVQYNDEIRLIGQRLAAEVQECQDLEVSCDILSLSFEAYLNGDILSIVLTQPYDYEYTKYTVHSFDLTQARQLKLTDFCEEYLDMDYPTFIMATNTLIEKEFTEKFETYAANESEFYARILDSIATDAVSILQRDLFLGENGQLMLLYNAPSMAGAGYYPTIAPFDVRKIGWNEEPEEEACYDYLFTLAIQSDEANTAACQTILKMAFDEDADDFSEELAKRSQEEIQAVASLLAQGYGIQKDQLAQYAGYLEEETVKTAILEAVEKIS